MICALDNCISRESQFVRKKSITVRAEEVYNKALNQNCVGGELPSFPDETWDREKKKLVEEIKESVKCIVRVDSEEKQSEHLRKLISQSEFLKFSQQEQSDYTWKGFIYNLKKGTMKFLLNSMINTLPTQSNLKLWNKSTTDKCLLCKNKETTLHILSGCKVALNQDRYTWRHDNVVRYISESVDKSKFEVLSDVDGFKNENGKTIPSFLTITADRPDIVILDKKNKKVGIFELTVPFESNIKERNTFKNNKYAYLLKDIQVYEPTVCAFEIGARGFITSENKARLSLIHKFCDKTIKLKNFLDNISSIVMNSSYYIYNCRKEPTWAKVSPLGPPINY